MPFYKDAKFQLAIFVAFAVIVSVLAIVAQCTHKEPGFAADAPEWDHMPLQVCSRAYAGAPGDGESAASVVDAVNVINERLGFAALHAAYGDCDIRVTLGAPAEAGWTDPGGNAHFGHVTCFVETVNVHGELLDLTIQHELGHCLGLAHDDYPQSIMRRVQTPTAERQLPPWISDYDRNILRARYKR